jgi:hypothetical protein
MPELGSYGSVRGAAGNSRPYREYAECPVSVFRSKAEVPMTRIEVAF